MVFLEHLLRQHSHPVSIHEPRSEVDSCELGEKWVGSYWCGFCDSVLPNFGTQPRGAYEARYLHIAEHIDSSNPPGGSKNWIELRGEGKTKAQMRAAIDELSNESLVIDNESVFMSSAPAQRPDSPDPRGLSLEEMRSMYNWDLDPGTTQTKEEFRTLDSTYELRKLANPFGRAEEPERGPPLSPYWITDTDLNTHTDSESSSSRYLDNEPDSPRSDRTVIHVGLPIIRQEFVADITKFAPQDLLLGNSQPPLQSPVFSDDSIPCGVAGHGFLAHDVSVLVDTLCTESAPSRSQRLTDEGYHSNNLTNPDRKLDTVADLEVTQTVYTGSDFGTVYRESFVQLFADCLLKDLRTRDGITHNTIRCSTEMLAEFTARLGQGECQLDMNAAIWFIHRYKDSIRVVLERNAEQLDAGSCLEEDEGLDLRPRLGESHECKLNILEDKMNRFFMDDAIYDDCDASNVPEAEDDLETISFEQLDDIEEPDDLDFEKYATMVRSHAAYEWLLHQLRPCYSPISAEHDVLAELKATMQNLLPKLTSLHRKKSPEMLLAQIEVDWSPVTFMQQQASDPTAAFSSLGKFCTLTGALSKGQASTCTEYVTQIWSDNGSFLLRMCNTLVAPGSQAKHTQIRADGAEFVVVQSIPNLIIRVSGSRGSIIETAQILAWLGAALNTQCSMDFGSVALRETFATVVAVDSTSHNPGCQIDGNVALKCSHQCLRKFKINFESQIHKHNGETGTCWLPLLSGMNIASGFPVRARDDDLPGLELPFDLMANLVGCEYIQRYDDQIYIRGFSAMLLPTLLTSNGVLVWHLCENQSGEYLSYLDHSLQTIKGLNNFDLSSYRHIVGWCDNANFFTGSADCNYHLQRAVLPRAQIEGGLANSTISAPHHVPKMTNVELPKSCIAIHLQHKGTSRAMQELSKHLFLLWDIQTERGWLVDGVTALLHLVRTSLTHEERDSVDGDFLFKHMDLIEPTLPHCVGSARRFLSDQSNMKQKISRVFDRTYTLDEESLSEPEEFELFEDRVKQLFILLEQTISYQEAVRRRMRQSKSLKMPLRYLEGWDFVRLAEQQSTIDPCLTVLAPAGEAWAGFVRSASIVTLFADGFGELIKPDAEMCCSLWQTLPASRFYIAASVTDIRRLIQENGNPGSSPPWLSIFPRYIWHRTSAICCGCLNTTESGFNDALVQTAWPFREQAVLPENKSLPTHSLKAEGAVVFGHNTSLSHFLTDMGPKIGKPLFEAPMNEIEDLFDDEGLGPSLKTLDSAESTDLTDVSAPQISRGHHYGLASLKDNSKAIMGDVHQTYNYYSCTKDHYSEPQLVADTMKDSIVNNVDSAFKALPKMVQKRPYNASVAIETLTLENPLTDTQPNCDGLKRRKISQFLDNVLRKDI